MAVSPPVLAVFAEIDTSPPTLLSLLSIDDPDKICTDDPICELPLPARIETYPAESKLEDPVSIATLPVDDVDDDPLDTVVAPVPSDPEVKTAAPPRPLNTETDPPESSVPEPATILTEPPTEPSPVTRLNPPPGYAREVEDPVKTSTLPGAPEEASPLLNKIDPVLPLAEVPVRNAMS